MKKFMKSKLILQIILASFITAIVAITIVSAATTIGTDISSGGTLTVYGVTSIGGALTATSTLAVTGATTLTGQLNFVNASSTGWFKAATIKSDTGAISFDDDNLSTSGTLTLSSGAFTFVTASSTGSSQLKAANINSDTGAISFDDETLTTTGTINFDTASSTGLASLQSLKVSSLGDTISNMQFGTCTVDPDDGGLGDGAATTTTCTAAGVSSGDQVFITPANLPASLFLVSASSTATDTIQVTIGTATTTTISGSYSGWSWMATN